MRGQLSHLSHLLCHIAQDGLRKSCWENVGQAVAKTDSNGVTNRSHLYRKYLIGVFHSTYGSPQTGNGRADDAPDHAYLAPQPQVLVPQQQAAAPQPRGAAGVP